MRTKSYFYIISILSFLLTSCNKDAAIVESSTSTGIRAKKDTSAFVPAPVAPAALYRTLTGDNTTINADSTATENGIKFSFSSDGSPSLPAISTYHYAGNKSIKITVPTDNSGNKQRFEYKILKAEEADGLHFNNYRYSSFVFMLDSTCLPFLGSCIFWQAWQGSPYGPPCMLKFSSGSSAPYRLRFTIRNMTTGPNSSDSDYELWNESLIYPGRWYRVLIYLRPDYTGAGNVKMWINDTLKVDWSGGIGYDPSQVSGAYNGLDIKNGIYQVGANNGHTIYFDNIKVADTYEEGLTLIRDK